MFIWFGRSMLLSYGPWGARMFFGRSICLAGGFGYASPLDVDNRNQSRLGPIIVMAVQSVLAAGGTGRKAETWQMESLALPLEGGVCVGVFHMLGACMGGHSRVPNDPWRRAACNDSEAIRYAYPVCLHDGLSPFPDRSRLRTWKTPQFHRRGSEFLVPSFAVKARDRKRISIHFTTPLPVRCTQHRGTSALLQPAS
jgi:hypothetical protein